jgi:hypothetical protein
MTRQGVGGEGGRGGEGRGGGGEGHSAPAHLKQVGAYGWVGHKPLHTIKFYRFATMTQKVSSA